MYTSHIQCTRGVCIGISIFLYPNDFLNTNKSRALPEQIRPSYRWMCASAEELHPLCCKMGVLLWKVARIHFVDTGTSCSETTMIVAKCVGVFAGGCFSSNSREKHKTKAKG